MPIIEVEDLSRNFNSFRAVDHVNFKVEEGSIFGYLGLNGAGKTTTVKMLTTIIPPTGGSATIGGSDVVKDPLNVRKMMGVVSEGEKASKPDWTLINIFYILARSTIFQSLLSRKDRLLYWKHLIYWRWQTRRSESSRME